jgi:ferritin
MINKLKNRKIMELTTKLTDAFNDQIQAEMWSSNLYLSMSVYFQEMGLSGCAHWMKKQTKEELEHAYKLIDYGIMRGGKIKISPLDAVPATWDSPLAVFEHTYNHELIVSRRIDALMDIAIAENDKATQEFLRWFVNEQVEEEDSAKSIIDKFKVYGVHGLYCIDHELGKR